VSSPSLAFAPFGAEDGTGVAAVGRRGRKRTEKHVAADEGTAVLQQVQSLKYRV